MRAALLLVTLYFGSGFAAAWLVTRPKRHRILDTPARHGMPVFEPVSFPARDGVTLQGWFIPAPARTPRGAVILCHGIDGDRTALLPVAAMLHRHGYAALLFDFRARGESGGSRCTLGRLESQDVIAAVAYLCGRPDMAGVEYALLGHSMGGAAVLLAHGGAGAAVVAESPFARLDHAIDNQFHCAFGLFGPVLAWPARLAGRVMIGSTPFYVAPVDHIGCLPSGTPVLLIQDADDRLCPPEETRELVRASGGRAALWTVPGAGHVGAVLAEPAEYERRVVGFLDAAFRQDARASVP